MKFSKELFFLIVILLLAIFLRFYKLTDIPNGFNQDESAIGYNAYSILKTAKDEYGKKYPIYFKSFGDEKLPAYIYLTALSEKFFGVNEFAVRFPSAFLGTLAILIFFLVLKETTKNKAIPLLASLLLAINPWHLFFSRAAFEDNIGLTFSLLGVWLFLFTLRSKKWFFFFPSMLFFALSLYSYNVTRLLSPVLLASLILFHQRTIKKLPKILNALVIIFFAGLLIPFFITFFSSAGAASAHGALITSTDIQAKSIEMRSFLLGPLSPIGKLFFNKYVYLVWQFLQNLVASLATPFFFITGSQHGSEGIGNNGTFYLFEFPLIIIGIVTILKNKQKSYYFFLTWAIVAWLTLSLSKEVPHATRGYFLVIPFEVFSALGLLTAVNWVVKQQDILKRNALIFTCGLIILYNLVYFLVSYFIRFPVVDASGWRQQDKPLAEFIKQNEGKYNRVIIDTNTGFIYTSLAFFTAYDPQTFQQTVKRTADDTEGFNQVVSFGKYQWKNVDWSIDGNDIHNLIILPQRKVPSKLKPLAIFEYPTIPEVLSVKEHIAQYPVQDTVYVAVQPKPLPRPSPTPFGGE